MAFQYLPHQKFNNIELLKPTDKRDKSNCVIWKCKCFCGNTFYAPAADVRKGAYSSCGCIKGIEKAHAKTSSYRVEGTNLLCLSSKKYKNNTSGYRGISWDTQRKKWIVQIRLRGKSHKIGRFEKIEDAIRARKEAEDKYFKPILAKYNGKELG